MSRSVEKYPGKHNTRRPKHGVLRAIAEISIIGISYNMIKADLSTHQSNASNTAKSQEPNPQFSGNQNMGSGKWVISSTLHEHLVNAGLNPQQISFVEFAAEANVTLANNGAPIQPAAVTAQNTFESSYGTDTISGPGVYNFGGHKGPPNENDSILVWTKENDGSGNLVSVKQWFRRYPEESLDSQGRVVHVGSLVANASMIQRLSWYADTVACGTRDPYKYLESEEFQLDLTTCERTGVPEPAYASADGDTYIKLVMDRMQKLHLDEDIQYQP